jgi:DNA-directed RNA polymerase III subunit RPC7
LKFFPKELWSTLDPKRQNPAWNTLGRLLPDPPGIDTAAKGKRKADAMPKQNARGKRRHVDIPSADDEDDVAIVPGRPKRAQKRDKDVAADAGQRKGLEAEDDYGPDAEQANDEDQDGEEVVEDSAFEESDDGAGDDYNAENYFDAGDDDDLDDGGGDDEGGTFLG